MTTRDYILKGGTIVDGSGTAPFKGDVWIHDQHLERLGSFEAPKCIPQIDCHNLIVAPGFIDSHTHSDLQVIEGRREKILQGVTTEVVGNCGFSAVPPANNPAELREFANGILGGDDQWAWPSSAAYLDGISRSATSHVVALIGHGSLRIAAGGNKQSPLSQLEMDRMLGLLEEAFHAGAAGLSTGLMYAPGSSATTEELEALCELTARHGRIYTSHIRSYANDLLTAVEEQIELARRTHCRLQISHLQAVGAANWSKHQRALDAIMEAHDHGVDVEFDCYPYIAGSSVLTQLLPQAVLTGGIAQMIGRLQEPSIRLQTAREINDTLPWRWSDIVLSAVGSASNAGYVGKTFDELAQLRGREPVDVLIDIIVEERGDANMLSYNQSEANLKLSLTHPLACIISDGYYTKGRPHPRLHGTFPLLFGQFCRERRWLTLSEAVHKITGKPSARYGLSNRGLVREGLVADLVVFDPDRIASPATYENPKLSPLGIAYVFLNGVITHGPADTLQLGAP